MADVTRYDDIPLFTQGFRVESSSTASAVAGSSGILSGAFVLADIQAGTKVFTSLPAGAVVRGCAVKITTPLTFSAGTTTDVTIKVGTATDDDAWFIATALAGTAGNRYPTAGGAGIGMATSGGSGKFTCTFTASAGGTPSLAEVSAGAGTVYLSWEIPG